MSLYDPFDDDGPGPGPRARWKIRRLDDGWEDPPRPPLEPGQFPPEIVHLAALLETTPEFIAANPRSYTPPTASSDRGNGDHLDPCKFDD